MADWSALRLKARGDAAELDRILQGQCREKYARKLSQTLSACGNFRFPSLLAGEQSSGDAAAALHASLMPPGATVLDMTAGLGIDVLHACERAAEVTALELDPLKADALRHNLQAMGRGNVTVVNADSTEWLRCNDRTFDVIMIDPARRDARGCRVFALEDCTPDVRRLMPLLRERARQLIIKLSPMLDVTAVMTALGGDVRLTGTRDECKELLSVHPGRGIVTVHTLDERGAVPSAVEQASPPARGISGSEREVAAAEVTPLELNPAEEAALPWTVADPVPGMYLYDPFPAVTKAGMPRLLCQEFGMSVPHPDTRLFLSHDLCPGFPGKAYRITDVLPPAKRTLRQLRGIQASVSTRNFPMSASALRARLQARESATRRLMGITTERGRSILLLEPVEAKGDM